MKSSWKFKGDVMFYSTSKVGVIWVKSCPHFPSITIPGSSEYVRFLAFGRFFQVKRHKFYTLGRSRYIYIYIYIAGSYSHSFVIDTFGMYFLSKVIQNRGSYVRHLFLLNFMFFRQKTYTQTACIFTYIYICITYV